MDKSMQFLIKCLIVCVIVLVVACTFSVCFHLYTQFEYQNTRSEVDSILSENLYPMLDKSTQFLNRVMDEALKQCPR